jgi:hypothetical protein
MSEHNKTKRPLSALAEIAFAIASSSVVFGVAIGLVNAYAP